MRPRTRISRYLLIQSLVNGIYGLGVGIGLYVLEVPHAMLWGFLGALLRFVPYVGPWIAALGPIALSLAVFSGWTRPGMVTLLFVILDLALGNFVLETLLYAGAAGVSAVGLLVAIAFWTWMWGPRRPADGDTPHGVSGRPEPTRAGHAVPGHLAG